ncbi:glycine betaine ABC transporter substrate-binding protein [Enteractinococcus fodinae]
MRPWRVPMMLLAGSLMLTACTGDDPEADHHTTDEEQDVIRIGSVTGWSDQAGIAHLYEYVLEENGYEVEVQDTLDVAPAYEAVAEGELDLYAAAWPEVAQQVYWEEHQDNVEDLGDIYQDAQLFLGVPEYSEITSIEELPDYADELNGQITGIESGAGLSVLTEEEVMPHYGLEEDFELQLSSASGMVGQLEEAIENNEEIVVTLWTPYWVTEQYDVRALEDPDMIYGEPENVHTLGRTGFAEDYPEIAAMIENFSLTAEQVTDLQDTMVNEFDDDDSAAVQAWAEDNPEVVDQMSADLSEA